MGKDQVVVEASVTEKPVGKIKTFVAKHKLGVGMALGVAGAALLDLVAAFFKNKKDSETETDPFVEE